MYTKYYQFKTVLHFHHNCRPIFNENFQQIFVKITKFVKLCIIFLKLTTKMTETHTENAETHAKTAKTQKYEISSCFNKLETWQKRA